MNILLCDDNAHNLKSIEILISQYPFKSQVNIISSTDPEMILKKLLYESYDIAFLDIEMKPISGIVLANELRKSNIDIVIIFATAHAEFSLQACKLACIDYLIKPIIYEQFTLAMDIAILRYEQVNALREKRNFLKVNIGYETYIVKFEEIVYCEKALRKVIIHTTKGEYMYYDTIAGLMCKLNNSMFIQCHNSFVVNRFMVNSASNKYLSIGNNQVKIPVSRKYKQAVNDKIK